jgi:hypothetical protein
MKNDPVLFSWHKNNCDDQVIQRHLKEKYLVCSTCCNYIQFEKVEPVEIEI